MAIQPCDVCHKRYVGPSSRAYVSILDSGEKWEHKPRLCPEHFATLLNQFRDVHGIIDSDAWDLAETQPCLVCHGPVTGKRPVSIFFTGYPARAERVDAYAPACCDCRPMAEVLIRGL